MTTAQQLIESAYARSTSNDPGKLAVDLELIQHLNRKYQQVWAIAAVAGGDNMLASTALTFLGSPPFTALPVDVVDLVRLQTAAGDKVHIIPVDERDRSWHLAPAVHRQGMTLVSRAKTGDPVNGDTLVLYHLDAPATLVALGSAIDARFPVRFENLLELDLAVYLSMKDEGRDAKEYAQLKSELSEAEQVFSALTLGSDYAKERPSEAQTAGKQ